MKTIQEPSLGERQEWDYKKHEREILITRTRAVLVKKQLIGAYEILENIRFDFLGDTVFRDCITKSKSGIEKAISDFLLDDTYHKENLEKHRAKTPKEFTDEKLNYGKPTFSSSDETLTSTN